MSDHKNVNVELDASSWTSLGKTVPTELTKLAGGAPRKMSVRIALLHTALCTRPPTSTGICLADYWAWLRYGPAIDSSADLRLRAEWDDIDPHQKTVLSDELGMGFTAYLLSRVLKFKSFADTIHFVNVTNPGKYKFDKRSRKNGKYKSPDFVALDSAGNPNNINVVECKGTQSSKKSLVEAVEGGIPQKQNLVSAGSSTINHSLAAGLFIPHKKSNEEAVIYVSDPPRVELSEIFARIAPERMQTAVVQVDLAKHFALMGLHSIANALVSTDISTASHLPDIDKQEVIALTPSPDNRDLKFEITFLLPGETTRFEGQGVRRARFSMTCPVDLYNRVAGTDNLERTLGDIVETASEQEWHDTSDEIEATLTTPLGFRLSLAYLPK
jgi:hypothetical protein